MELKIKCYSALVSVTQRYSALDRPFPSGALFSLESEERRRGQASDPPNMFLVRFGPVWSGLLRFGRDRGKQRSEAKNI